MRQVGPLPRDGLVHRAAIRISEIMMVMDQTHSPLTPSPYRRARDAAAKFYWSKSMEPFRFGVRRARAIASPTLWHRRATASRRRLPDFLIIGAMKAGTTSLFSYLSRHPQCIPSMTKEVHYFDRNFTLGINWYRMHFPLSDNGSHGCCETTTDDGLLSSSTDRFRKGRTTREPSNTKCFEASPCYMLDPRTPARIRGVLPNVKLICLLRDPVARTFSHYQHNRNSGAESLSFEHALDAETDRLAGEEELMMENPSYWSLPLQFYSYRRRSEYATQLADWMSQFPSEQIKVVQTEQLVRQPNEALAEVLDFLELDPWSPPEFGVHKKGEYSETMSRSTRDYLVRHFAPHNERLFDLLGRQFAWARS